MTTASLSGRAVGIDARYLKRPGIGISWYLQQAIRDLVDAGAVLSLLTDEDAHAAELRRTFAGTDVVSLPGRSGFLWEQLTLRRHLAVACYDAYIAPANYGLPLRYRGRTQLILVVHDLIPLRLAHIYLLPRPGWAAKYLLSLLIAAVRADRVVAVSNATARDVARLLRRPRADVAYPPIPQRAPSPAPRPAAAPTSLGTPAAGSPYFVYNGGTDQRKNVPVLLRAFRQVRNELGSVDLVLLGTGYEAFGPLVAELGIESGVRMPGYVDETAKAAILRSALAMVYPSSMEGFGLPVVEALAAGIPVICGVGGALREVGGPAAIYVQPVTPGNLAAAMVAATAQEARQRAQGAGTVQLAVLSERRASRTLAGIVAECTRQSLHGEHAAI